MHSTGVAAMLVSMALMASAQADTCPAIDEIIIAGERHYASVDGQWKGTGPAGFSANTLIFIDASISDAAVTCTYADEDKDQAWRIELQRTPGKFVPVEDYKWPIGSCSAQTKKREECTFVEHKAGA